MRKLIILLVGLMSLTCFVSCEKQDAYNLKVNVKNFDSGMAYLVERKSTPGPADLSDAIDSAQIISGTCLFKGKVNAPVVASLLVVPNNSYGKEFNLILENTDFELNCDYSSQIVWLRDTTMTITGSELNDFSVKISDVTDPIYYEIIAANRKGDVKKTNDLKEVLEVKFIDLIKQNPASLELAYKFYQNYMRSEDYQLLNMIFENFDSSMSQNKYISFMIQKMEKIKATAIGQVAPEIVAPDTLGQAFALSSLRGKYVFVDFWASWCGPCCKEIPEIVKMYTEFKSDKFEILGVSFDSDADRWKKAIKKYDMRWINISDVDRGKKVTSLYPITGIPFNVLIDPEGKILARNLHGEELYKKIESLLTK